jgi:DNA-binding transcriptional MerR regulator
LGEEKIIINEPVKVLTTTIIGKQLGLGESTIRKHFNYLQKAGYQFEKEQNGTRVFREKDVNAIKELLLVKNKTGVSLTMAASVVVSRTEDTDSVHLLTPELFEAAKERIEKRMLVEFQKELVNEMAILKEDIEDKIIEENKLLKDELSEMKSKMDQTNEMMKLILEKQNEVKEPVIDEEKELLKTRLDEMTLLLEKKNEEKEETVVVEEKKGWFKNIFKL